MNLDKNLILLPLALVALLLFGCTINPQDADPSSQNAGNAPGTSGATGSSSAYSLEDVAKHGVKGDCWMAIDGRILDLSGYTTHPGGDTFVPYCGKDGTEGFATLGGRGRNHSARAYAEIDDYVIGTLEQ